MPIKGKKGSKIAVDFSGVETKDYSLPNGDYVLAVTSVEKKTSEASGNEYLAWEFKVAEGQYKGRKVWENTSLQPQALWKLRQLLEAFGMEVEEGEMELDLDDFADEQVGVTVENEKYQGKDKPRVIAYLSLSEVESDDTSEPEDTKPQKKSAPSQGNGEVKESAGPKRKKPAAPEVEVGMKVTFDDDGTTYNGKVTAIADELATVKVGKDEWELSLSELTPA